MRRSRAGQDAADERAEAQPARRARGGRRARLRGRGGSRLGKRRGGPAGAGRRAAPARRRARAGRRARARRSRPLGLEDLRGDRRPGVARRSRAACAIARAARGRARARAASPPARWHRHAARGRRRRRRARRRGSRRCRRRRPACRRRRPGQHHAEVLAAQRWGDEQVGLGRAAPCRSSETLPGVDAGAVEQQRLDLLGSAPTIMRSTATCSRSASRRAAARAGPWLDGLADERQARGPPLRAPAFADRGRARRRRWGSCGTLRRRSAGRSRRRPRTRRCASAGV